MWVVSGENGEKSALGRPRPSIRVYVLLASEKSREKDHIVALRSDIFRKYVVCVCVRSPMVDFRAFEKCSHVYRETTTMTSRSFREYPF